MKRVSYQSLKRDLSGCLDAAAAGEELLITRHEKPVALLIAAERQGMNVGARFGRFVLAPAFERKTEGRYLQLLQDDRDGGERDR